MAVDYSTEHSAFEYVELRGENIGIDDLVQQLSRFEPGELTLVVLDAKYRFFAAGAQENSNDDQTQFHNAVDRLARRLDCAIVLVHHATKGDQGGKSVTDVGSGGGSQSRTVDCHLVIRPHEQSDDLAVLDAAVRTFAPVEPQTLRWEFPLWRLEEFTEPLVRQPRTRGDSRQEVKDRESLSQLANVFHESRGQPLSRYELRTGMGCGYDRVNRLIRIGIDQGVIEKTGTRPNEKKPDEPVEVFILASDYVFHDNENISPENRS